MSTQTTTSQLLCGCTEVQPCDEHEAKVLFTAEEKMFRDAILDVIDDQEVFLWSYQQDTANVARLDFADAVVQRARKIKQFDEDESR